MAKHFNQKEYQIQYRKKNKEKIAAYNKIYGKKHYLLKGKAKKDNNIASWEGYFPEIIKCEVCGVETFFNKKNLIRSVNFDHRTNKEVIKGSPNRWLLAHPRTLENQRIWESCSFGKLCLKCNRVLPTTNREGWIQKMLKYVSSY